MNYRKQHLAGITIVEVLFSVGIIVTGLLGVAGLIMIAGTQMSQGIEVDAMSNTGLNAIAEFDTRKMRRPDSLLWYNPSTRSFTSALSNDLYGPGNEASPSFCIDPFFIAQQVVDGNANIYESNLFPGIQVPTANPNQIAQMRRVTLINPSGIANLGYPTGTQNILTLLQSREIFTIKDDLLFNIPTTATELPQQSWITDQATANANSPRQTNGIDDDHDGVVDELDEANVKRLNAAETSWMATLTPNRKRMNVPGVQYEPTDQYMLSIVIFNNRFINYTDANAGPEKERLLNITFLNRGFGGGEVRLSHTTPAALELKHGDWVMLSAYSGIGSCFRWYRISYIEDETRTIIGVSGNVTGHYRDATLKGPDWNRPEWHNGTYTTHVTFIPGVIGVFEKTIRMESTSLY